MLINLGSSVLISFDKPAWASVTRSGGQPTLQQIVAAEGTWVNGNGSDGKLNVTAVIPLNEDALAPVAPFILDLSSPIQPAPSPIAASENVIGAVGSPDIIVSVAPNVAVPAYSSGFVVGGMQTIPNAARLAGKPTLLESIVITDVSNQKAPLSLFFFSASPAGASGAYADHAALALGTGDLTKCIGKVDIAAADYDAIGAGAVATIKGIGLLLAPIGTSLYVVAVTTGTPTYATLALNFIYGFLRS